MITLHPIFGMKCSLSFVCGVSLAFVRKSLAEKNNNVPERIRAAGFTELQSHKPQRDDLTTNRQGLSIIMSNWHTNAKENLPPLFYSKPANLLTTTLTMSTRSRFTNT
jgi:hypothetical protein